MTHHLNSQVPIVFMQPDPDPETAAIRTLLRHLAPGAIPFWFPCLVISLQPPSSEVATEAVGPCFYKHKTDRQQYPRLQLNAVKELMGGKGIERPSTVAVLEETLKIRLRQGRAVFLSGSLLPGYLDRSKVTNTTA